MQKSIFYLFFSFTTLPNFITFTSQNVPMTLKMIHKNVNRKNLVLDTEHELIVIAIMTSISIFHSLSMRCELNNKNTHDFLHQSEKKNKEEEEEK